ncbi:MAG TPA: carboxypeptidase-like regulatory domain-containing protein, partial [Arenibacter sp.]|nr:carboxypeptidase-like regulatory domain-containing protein [Arenibacter sp.]
MNLKLLSFSILFLVMGNLLSYSQEITVKGAITSSEDNMPLPGANVILKNGTRGTVTDFDGLYEITVPVGAVLVYSYQGFKTEEVGIQSQN